MITRKELEKIIEMRADIEKISTISSDGRNLLIRIPKDVREHLYLVKGDKIRWFVDSKKKIKIEVIKK